jgi:S-adenosylmethionine-dependent methyltransferase
LNKQQGTKMTDRNFDKLADKFESRIYGTFKGRLRLELLEEDLSGLREGERLDVWDAGCGGGRMAVWFAQRGHRVIGCDISEKMLAHARQRVADAGVSVALHHTSAQELAPTLPQQDLVLFHAVIEWLADPTGTLQTIAERVKPGGHLSLMFFNHHALVYRNAMRGQWRIQYLLDQAWWGKGKNLTPPYPQKPEELIAWFQDQGWQIVAHTGIRVFHDYLHDEAREATDLEEMRLLEHRYCRDETFRNMGRYVHLLVRKSL